MYIYIYNTNTCVYIIQSLEQEILPLATPWIDLEGNMLSIINKREKKQTLHLIYMWDLKKKLYF